MSNAVSRQFCLIIPVLQRDLKILKEKLQPNVGLGLNIILHLVSFCLTLVEADWQDVPLEVI